MARDAEALQRAAHTLKSNGASIGAARLSANCREIERLARAGDLSAAALLLERAAGDLEQTLETLTQVKAAA